MRSTVSCLRPAGVAALVLSLACGAGKAPPSAEASGQVSASQGGTLEIGGARLVIQPGALSQDALVKLRVGPPPPTRADNPLQPTGPPVSVDLGGAALSAPASLELPAGASPGGVAVVLEAGADGVSIVHAAGPVVSAAGQHARTPTRAYSLTRGGSYAIWVMAAPTESGGAGLEVPFYWQAGYPWCVPTSLAMALNYFEPFAVVSARSDAPSGRVSSFGLASVVSQSPGSGTSISGILDGLGLPAGLVQGLNWDEGLVNGIQFQTYVRLVTGGIPGLAPPRPLEFASDKAWHAKVLVGGNADRIFVNNSNDRWSGTLPSETWAEFFAAACDLADPADPTKGCSGKPNNGIYTTLFFADPRPETERRGSLELAPADQGEDPTRSLRFYAGFGQTLSSWRWDGRDADGYYFTDEGGLNRMPSANAHGHAIPASARMLAAFEVVNTTNADLTFQVTSRLLLNGVEQRRPSQVVAVPALSRLKVTPFNGTFSLDDLAAGGVQVPADAMLDLLLEQGGVLQDEKQIHFEVVPPTMVPSAVITSPSPSTPVYRGIPAQVSGFADETNPATGLSTIPVACEHLFWSSSVAADLVPSSCTGSATFASNGPRTLTLTAVGYQGAAATASVAITVTDPPVNLPPIIDAMHVVDSLGNEIGDGQVVATTHPLSLSVVAHDPEGDPLTFQWSACLTGWTPLFCALHGTLPTSPTGTASFDPLQQGTGIWTFSVTADDGHQPLATIRSRTITVDPVIN